jgi:hypothetical protein
MTVLEEKDAISELLAYYCFLLDGYRLSETPPPRAQPDRPTAARPRAGTHARQPAHDGGSDLVSVDAKTGYRLDERVTDAADEGELGEIYENERRLLYVACTRAREHLLLTGVKPVSEYLADLNRKRGASD